MMDRLRHAMPLALLCGGMLAAPGDATAQSVEQFYRGRTINVLVGSAPGGINDLVARLIARHLGNHLPGKPVLIVQNLQSSGLAVTNRIYAGAEKDGTIMAMVERGSPQLAIQGDPNARFDPLKLTWLGSVSSYAHDAYVLWVNATFAARTIADLKAPSTLTARIGTTGAGATNLVFTQIAKDILGLNVQNVRGYRGAADAFLAQQRGEIDGQVVGLSSVKVGQPALYKANFLRPLVAFARTARYPDYPDVPTGRELATSPKAQAILAFAEAPFFMALPLVAPPDLPPERARALQTAFMAMTRDPAFKAEADKMNLEQSPIDGAAVLKIIAEMAATPKDLIAQFNEIMSLKH